MNAPLFRLSLLSLTLAAGFAHAAGNANVALDTVTVKGDRQGSKGRTTSLRFNKKTKAPQPICANS